jgi:hypothetical protein
MTQWFPLVWLVWSCFAIGGHSVWYPWSAISDWAWYHIVRYRTEERRVRHYIGYRNKLLSDIRYLTWRFVNSRCPEVRCWILDMKTMGSKPVRKLAFHHFSLFIWEWFINFRYWNIQYWFSPISEWKLNVDVGTEADVDIGTIPISEWKDLVRHFLFRYRNKRCQCRLSDVRYARPKGRCRCPPLCFANTTTV